MRYPCARRRNQQNLVGFPAELSLIAWQAETIFDLRRFPAKNHRCLPGCQKLSVDHPDLKR